MRTMQFLKSNAIDEGTLRGETLFSLTVPENNMSLLFLGIFLKGWNHKFTPKSHEWRYLS